MEVGNNNNDNDDNYSDMSSKNNNNNQVVEDNNDSNNNNDDNTTNCHYYAMNNNNNDHNPSSNNITTITSTFTTTNHHHHPTNDMFLDVSINPWCWLVTCPILHCGFCPYSTVLRLRTYDVERTDVTICGTRTSVRPYEELGDITINNNHNKGDGGGCGGCFYWCCICIDSNLGNTIIIVPGYGYNRTKAEIIIKELQYRVKKCNHPIHHQLSEQILHKTILLNEKLDCITNHLVFVQSNNNNNDNQQITNQQQQQHNDHNHEQLMQQQQQQSLQSIIRLTQPPIIPAVMNDR